MHSAATPPVRIVLADDHPILRDGLRRLIQAEAGFEVVGEAHDGRQAVELVRALQPDVLLLDLAMPKVTGLDAIEELSKENTTVKTIFLTAAIDSADIVKALQFGARGVVLKESATELLFKCIRCVMAGQYWVGREGVADLVQTLRSLLAPAAKEKERDRFGLTKRELAIVGAIVEGNTNRDIAKRFSISEDTVKHHLTNVFNKTGVSSRLELGLFAMHHKLIDQA